MSTTKTEPLTDEMIRKLRSEAAAAGDSAQVRICNQALANRASRRGAREDVAETITSARAMDDSKPFVRVVP